MDELIMEFIASLKRRETTRDTYRKALREFSKWLGSVSPTGLTADDITRYKDYILSKKLSPTSMSAYLTAVRRFYDYLVSAGKIKENPAKKVKGGRRPERHLTDTISRNDVDRLLRSIDTSTPLGLRDRAVLSLMVRSGLSEIQIVRANLGDIKSRDGKKIIYVQGKNKDRKDEYVPLSSAVEQALEHYLESRGTSGGDEPLFWGIGNRSIRERISTRGVRARVNHYLEISGTKKKGIKPVSLRHTAAILAIQEGATISEIKRMLGLKTTESALVYFEEAGEAKKS